MRVPPGSTPDEIASMMLDLQERGCHNVNFVTPEHVVPQVIEAVELAVDRGLSVPIVYNTSAYDAVESIELLEESEAILSWNPGPSGSPGLFRSRS